MRIRPVGDSPRIAILANDYASDQRSMIGYGDFLLESAVHSGFRAKELRAASLVGQYARDSKSDKLRKVARNIDRFLVTPLKLAGKSSDIVHVVDPGNVVYLPIVNHGSSVVTVHDMIPFLAMDGVLNGFSPTKSGRFLMKNILKKLALADRIVCVSEATKRDLLTYVEIPEKKVMTIPNAVFQSLSPALPEDCVEFKSRAGLPLDKSFILHVGKGFYKNRETVIDVLAEVRRRVPNIELVLVGELTSSLERRISSKGLSGACHVLKHVSHNDMSKLYTSAALLLFPSLYEGFGLPVLEAQLCGTAVVCSNAGSLPEVVDSRAKTHEPFDVDGLSDSVLETIADSNSGRCDELLGIDLIRKRFSQDEWAKRHSQLYHDLLCPNRGLGV